MLSFPIIFYHPDELTASLVLAIHPVIIQRKAPTGIDPEHPEELSEELYYLFSPEGRRRKACGLLFCMELGDFISPFSVTENHLI